MSLECVSSVFCDTNHTFIFLPSVLSKMILQRCQFYSITPLTNLTTGKNCENAVFVFTELPINRQCFKEAMTGGEAG